MVEQCYQNALDMVVKNQNLLKEKQETKGLLRSIGIKTPLNKITLWGDILF